MIKKIKCSLHSKSEESPNHILYPTAPQPENYGKFCWLVLDHNGSFLPQSKTLCSASSSRGYINNIKRFDTCGKLLDDRIHLVELCSILVGRLVLAFSRLLYTIVLGAPLFAW